MKRLNAKVSHIPLGKITSRVRAEDVPKRHPLDVPYGPLCNAKGRPLPTS